MKKLRLLLWPDCNRSCPGCCNKQWDLDKLPRVSSYEGYDEILLTGGEPMLYPERLQDIIRHIRMCAPRAKIIVYTAATDCIDLVFILAMVDGMTITLHDKHDVTFIKRFISRVPTWELKLRSVRLNVFKGISIKDIDISNISVKTGITWIKKCPLPEGEVFMRL